MWEREKFAVMKKKEKEEKALWFSFYGVMMRKPEIFIRVATDVWRCLLYVVIVCTLIGVSVAMKEHIYAPPCILNHLWNWRMLQIPLFCRFGITALPPFTLSVLVKKYTVIHSPSH